SSSRAADSNLTNRGTEAYGRCAARSPADVESSAERRRSVGVTARRRAAALADRRAALFGDRLPGGVLDRCLLRRRVPRDGERVLGVSGRAPVEAGTPISPGAALDDDPVLASHPALHPGAAFCARAPLAASSDRSQRP